MENYASPRIQRAIDNKGPFALRDIVSLHVTVTDETGTHPARLDMDLESFLGAFHGYVAIVIDDTPTD